MPDPNNGRAPLRTRRTFLALSTILASGVAAPALGQTGPKPSIYKNIDENGVDLTDGTFNIAIREGSIGSGEGAIELWRYGGSRAASDNLTVSFSRSVLNGVASIGLTLGNRLETFSGPAAATSFTSNQGNGATLTKTSAGEYRYVSADGSVTTYGPPPGLTNAINNGFCSPGAEVACGLVAVSTREPNGVVTTYEWDVGENCTERYDRYGEPIYECAQFYRQRGLSNNLGYAVRFAFQQEANPTTGLPGNAWRTRSGATFTNTRVAGAARSVIYAYPSADVVEVTDDGGRVWRLTYNASTGVTAVRRPGSNTNSTTIAYGAGGVISVTRDGVTTSYNRVVSGTAATTTVTNALSQVTVVTSDLAIGRPTSVRTPDNQTTSFGYDASGRLKITTAPEGNSRSYVHDARGNVTQVTDTGKPAAGSPVLVSSFSFPASCANPVTCNKPDASWDPKNNRTDYAYDPAHGGVTSVTRPTGANGVRPQARYGYSAVGSGVTLLTSASQCQTQASCAGTADERRTTIAYDHPNLLPTGVTTGSGDGALAATTAVTYTPAGDVASVDGPLPGSGDTTTYRYDAARRNVGVIGPDPDGSGPRKRAARRVAFNADDQVTLAEAGTATGADDASWNAFGSGQQASATYDANGRKLRDAFSAGGQTYSVTDYGYDAVGRPECVAVRMNPAAFGAMPGACALGAQGGDGPDRITRTSYDAAGRVAGVTSGFGTAEASTDGTSHTANGQVKAVTDANGNVTSYAYDGFDRLSTTTYPGGSFEQLGYDAAGNVVSRRLRDGTSIGFVYDALNRVITKTLPAGESAVGYTYDLLGQMTAMTRPGDTVALTYDALGRLISDAQPHGTLTYQYDAAGRRTRTTWGPDLHVTYDYLVTGEVSAIRENGAASGVGVLATYAYDDFGRRVRLTRGNGVVTTYAYDPASRLAGLNLDLAGTTHDQGFTFGYNPAGQIASRTASNDLYAWRKHYNVDRPYGVNGLNQLTSAGATALGYDGRGNLTQSGSTAYAYTSENQLKSVAMPAVTSLRYDAGGRLAQVTNTSDNLFVYDGGRMASSLKVASGVTSLARRWVWGPGADEALLVYEGAGITDRRWMVTDERGSVVAVTDAAGAATAINTYDEYGIPGNPGFAGGQIRYAGQAWLSSIGLSYNKARMYSPTLGRFMQTDPIGYADGLNWYNYVGSDPVNMVDPTGLQARNPPPTPKNLPHVEGAEVVVEGGSMDGVGLSGNLAASANSGPGFGVNTVLQASDGSYYGPDVVVRLIKRKPQSMQPVACPIAYTPQGDTKGENPRPASGRYNTDLPGGFQDAWKVFSGLSRLAGEPSYTIVPNPSFSNATTLAVSQPGGSVRLRVGVDYSGGARVGLSPRIDIKAGTFDLKVAETIHFTGGKGNMCPTP